MASEALQSTVIRAFQDIITGNPQTTFIQYPNDQQDGYKSLNGSQLSCAVRHGAEAYLDKFGPFDEQKRVIAYLSTSNVTYLFNVLSLLSVDRVPLLLSPRNSVAGIADLIRRAKASAILVEPGKFDRLVADLQQELGDEAPPVYESLVMQDFPRGENTDGKATEFVLRDPPADMSIDTIKERHIMGSHSSGSTSFPKLRFWRNRNIWAGTVSKQLTRERWTRVLLPAPQFHAMGVNTTLMTLRMKATVVFPLKGMPYRPADLLRAITLSEANASTMPPSMLEDVVQFCNLNGPECWEAVNRLNIIIVGGAPCPNEVAKEVEKHGVRILSYYGSTEAGACLMTDLTSGEWDELRPCLAENEFKFERVDDNEPVFKLLVRTNIDGFAAGVTDEEWYDTNDLWLRVRPNHYRYYGRNDDIIVHVNGEKTNPVPMEMALRTHPLIHDALIVGAKRFQTAALILLDVNEALKLSPTEMMEAVYAQIPHANEEAPQHSKLVRELVEILPLNHQDFPRTEGKGNVKRRPAEKMLSGRIDKLYAQYDQGHSAEANAVPGAKAALSYDAVVASVLKAATKISSLDGNAINDKSTHTTSLFELGLDSLGAVALGNELGRTFGLNLPRDIVMSYSSVHDLATYLTSFGGADDTQRIRESVAKILGRPVSEVPTDDTSLFDVGLDSLGATALEKELSRTLGRPLPQGVVFDHSSVVDLANFLSGSPNGQSKPSAVAAQKTQVQQRSTPVSKEHLQLTKTRDLLNKYLTLLPELRNIAKERSPPCDSGVDVDTNRSRVVVVTGATGALGSCILEHLLTLRNVSKVYSLHRGPDGLDRELKAFEQRGMDTKLIERASKDGRVKGLDASFGKEKLGLEAAVYDEIEKSATDIIHSAWPVNWSFPVEAYDSSIMGIFNFIKLCVGKYPKTFNFVSSIASYNRPAGKTLIPETPVPDAPEQAGDMGYARSKWVAERLIGAASASTSSASPSGLGLDSKIYRCGQLAGDSRTGAWNTTDFFATLIATGANLRSMPKMTIGANGNDELSIDWIPMDAAARAISELAGLDGSKEAAHRASRAADAAGSTAREQVYHIVDPNRASWNKIFDALKRAGYPIESVVSPDAWIDTIERLSTEEKTSSKGTKKNPAYSEAMMPVFREMLLDQRDSSNANSTSSGSTDSPPMAMPRLDTQATTAQSRQLQQCLNIGDAGYWKNVLGYFKNAGILA